MAWVVDLNNLPDYVKFGSRSHDAVIRVYDDAGNVIETARGRVSKNREDARIFGLASLA